MLKAYAAKTAIAGPSPRPLRNCNNSQQITSSMSVPTAGNKTQQRPDTLMSNTSNMQMKLERYLLLYMHMIKMNLKKRLCQRVLNTSQIFQQQQLRRKASSIPNSSSVAQSKAFQASICRII